MHIQNALERLVSLAGTDPGFYVLALHSFVEGYCNTLSHNFSVTAKFNEVIDLLLNHLEKKGALTGEDRKALIRIAKEHESTNRVRHQFISLTKEEAQAATHNFLCFCRAFSINERGVETLKATLNMWDSKKTPLEMVNELHKLRTAIDTYKEAAHSAWSRLKEYQELEKKLQEAVQQVQRYEKELSQLRETASYREQRVDELRKRLQDSILERNKLLEQTQRYQDIERYLQYLERFTVYTRTRSDYERSVLKLSHEQEEAVSLIKTRGDYIIKGKAGTGKTLVLLHALARTGNETALSGHTIFLTYTNTLVKYSTYLSHILSKHQNQPQIVTADSFLLKMMGLSYPGIKVDFSLPRKIIKDFNTTGFLSDEELSIEIDDFLWGNRVNYKEYIELSIPRKGMKQPLSRAQRQTVWKIKESIEKFCISHKTVSRNHGINLLLDMQDVGKGLEPNTPDRIFIDEAQDLPLAFLQLLKRLSRNGIILALDQEQSIYTIGAPYQRMGLEITGHVRTLTTNYRNTTQIKMFAEAFRNQGVTKPYTTASSREGPFPEIVQGENTEALLSALIDYIRLMAERVGYDLENIVILCPTNQWIEKVHNHLCNEKVPSINVREEGFDFEQPGALRLCTLHSSKGIEFPVVLLFLPSLPPVESYDPKQVYSLQKNLLYVACTRAMDFLAIFLKEHPEEPILQELRDARGKL